MSWMIRSVNRQPRVSKIPFHELLCRHGSQFSDFGFRTRECLMATCTVPHPCCSLSKLFGITLSFPGIWMCRDRDKNILVMDVEGTDGRERGEDKDFERKSALFSLASSQVLIVNLLEHQVGLYQAANMGLLKTVFEVNLALFGHKSQKNANPRTLLLFVIRDHLGRTPLANLRETLTADMQRIWDTLSKPAGLKDRKLKDYFDLSFTALPHKFFPDKKFESDVRTLRGRFTDKSRNDFVFKPAYHKRIPADGIAFYMKDIWEQVRMNKDLDLPMQQELLAQFRCDEISEGTFREFNDQAKPEKCQIKAGGFGVMMRALRSQALSRYDREAKRYHQEVYKRKRADLVKKLDSALSLPFLRQIQNIRNDVLVSFKAEIDMGLNIAGYNFADFNGPRANAVARFIEGAREAVITEGDPTWQWADELQLLQKNIQAVIDQLCEDRRKFIKGVGILTVASAGAVMAGGAAVAGSAAGAGGMSVARVVGVVVGSV
ncbi:root hair defective 3 GTP-binding protein-domain-containing protein [Lactifluus volemus]|nr:root hair defective 3 GTP-binding protein-domain-containing protein [Lactifluus volemus]